MNKKKNLLRAAAEEQLQQASTTDSATYSPEELLHEFQVHQIELEMQNENLRQAYEAVAESRQEYFELYEFAPIGYLTLSQLGLIEKINLTGATLLGENRSQLLQRRFARYINTTDATRWHLFFAQVMLGNEQKTLEVTLKQPNNKGLCVQLHCIPMLKEDKQPTLWITLTDMTKSKQADGLVVELAFQNTEKENRAAELGIANIELAFQNEEKEKHGKIERALQKSEEKLNFLLLNAPVTIFTCEVTPPFRATYISPNITATLGYLPEQFLENCNFWKSHIHPDDVAQVYENLSQLFKKDTLQHEYRFRIADGSYRCMYDELRLTRDETGEPNQIIGFWMDISDRKQIEQQIIEAHSLLRTIIDTVPVRIFWKDTNLCFVGGNMNFAKDAGMSRPEELIGKDDYQMAWANQAELYRSDDLAVIKSGISKLSYVEPITIMNGLEQWVSTSKVPLKNQHNEVIGLLGVYEDITERKRLEKSIHDSESKFRTLFDSSSDAIMLWDTLFFDCNQAALTLFGCKTVAEFCTYHPADLSPLEQPCGTSSLILEQQYIATALKIGSFRFEWTHKKIDTGEIFVAEVLLSALIVNEKPVLQATLRDITERKAIEEKIQQLAFYDPLTGL
ncbi:MAG: PAS domain S-box protein, partial [Methylococcales bacterium]